jgi:hypothetical protein
MLANNVRYTCALVKAAFNKKRIFLLENGLRIEEETGKVIHLEQLYTVLKLGRSGQ